MTGILSGLNPLKNNQITNENEIIVSLPINLIYSGIQDRKTFTGIDELAISIQQLGQQLPIIVQAESDGRYRIIAGERRYRAIQAIPQDTIKALIKSESSDDKSNSFTMLVENIAREDLTIFEKAVAFKKRIDDYDITADNLAEILGKTPSYIRKHLAILNYGAITQSIAEQGLVAQYDNLAKLNKIELESSTNIDTIKQHLLDGVPITKAITNALEHKASNDTGIDDSQSLAPIEAVTEKSIKVSIGMDVLCALIAKYERRDMFAYDAQSDVDILHVKSKLKDITKKVEKNAN